MTGRDPSESHRGATPLELLFDLAFVVAFGQASAQLAHLIAEGHLASGLVDVRATRVVSGVALLELGIILGDNGRVLTMTEPQVWVLIGVFTASIFGMLGIVTTNFTRTLNSAIGGLRETMDARFGAMDAKFDGRFEAMDAKFEGLRSEVNSKFDTIDVKLENMDRDIQALSRHDFGTDPR